MALRPGSQRGLRGARQGPKSAVPFWQSLNVPRVQEILIQYGQPSSSPGLEWAWVDAQLTQAGTYWASLGTNEQPHPRPVWGIWADEALHLSIGSPKLAAAQTGGLITVHPDSGTDVVIVEGSVESRSVVRAPSDALRCVYWGV